MYVGFNKFVHAMPSANLGKCCENLLQLQLLSAALLKDVWSESAIL